VDYGDNPGYRYNYPANTGTEKEILRDQAATMKVQLEEIEKRISELENKETE
jgi:hypothetical protein